MLNERDAASSLGSRRAITAAHLPAILLGALLIIALILGIAEGQIGLETFHQPVPSPNDPITVP